MHTRSREKGAVSPQETEPDLPTSVQESLAEVWAAACCGVRSTGNSCGCTIPAEGSGALSAAVWEKDLLKEVANVFITSTIVWSQVKQ